MENKKTIIGIIILVILIIGLIVVSYFYNSYNKNQINLLAEETNKLLESDLTIDEIDFNIKTEKGFATVENAIKEYISKIKNIYTEMDNTCIGINPDNIFIAENMPDKNLDEIDVIISDYKEKGQELLEDYDELIKEENIKKYIEEKNIKTRKKYYTNLYTTTMLSDSMKTEYQIIRKEVSARKDDLYSKLNELEKVKEFLEDNKRSWTIKDNKIVLNSSIVGEYYNLINKVNEY